MIPRNHLVRRRLDLIATFRIDWLARSMVAVMLSCVVPLAARGQLAEGVKEGDLFVGAASYFDNFGGAAGPRGIFRVRSGNVTPFSLGPPSPSDPDYFFTPHDVIVDSQGRVVWLAELYSGTADDHIGLFRASGIGATPEKLAIFRVGNHALNDGYPNPFPNAQLTSVVGLHLASNRRIEIDDDANNGLPRVVTEDAYVMGLVHATEDYPNFDGVSTVSYGANTGVWDDTLPEPVYHDNWPTRDLISHQGAIYSIDLNRIRRSSMPLKLDASGTIDFGSAGSLEFSVGLSMFGGSHDVLDGTIIDDTRIPNINSGVPSDYPSPPSHVAPWEVNALVPASGLRSLAYSPDLGLVLRSDYGWISPFVVDVSETLLNDNPEDDRGAYFWREIGGDWVGWPSLGVTRLFPKGEPVPGSEHGYPASISPLGDGQLIGTISATGSVVSVTEGGVNVQASGLVAPSAVGTYPTYSSPATGLSVIIRVDSPIDVLLTAPDGRQIGTDPETDLPVNDFGENGFDSGQGEPRFFGIRDSVAGDWTVDAIGTGDGPFAINVYGIDLDNPLGTRARMTGMASTGSRLDTMFQLDDRGNVNYLPLPGDYNQDGAVDAADYVVWRDGLGASYTSDDYNVWRAHFGQSIGSGTAAFSAQPLSATAPEPSSLTLYMLTIVWMATLRGPPRLALRRLPRTANTKALRRG